MKSNLEHWKVLQSEGYFEKHVCYGEFSTTGGTFDVDTIAKFFELQPHHVVVNIGCGFGREALHIAPKVAHVYGIDVSEEILAKAVKFLADNGVSNFTPAPAERYKEIVPQSGIDFVYCIVVMQHLTRDLCRDYVTTLGQRLAPGGRMLIQFIHELFDGVDAADAELRPYEPSISWTAPQIVDLARDANLDLVEIRSTLVTPTCLWNWTLFGKSA